MANWTTAPKAKSQRKAGGDAEAERMSDYDANAERQANEMDGQDLGAWLAWLAEKILRADGDVQRGLPSEWGSLQAVDRSQVKQIEDACRGYQGDWRVRLSALRDTWRNDGFASSPKVREFVV